MLTWPRIGPWLSAAISIFAIQTSSQSIAAPNIDFDQLGDVAVAGNFDALSVYQYTGQREGFSQNGTNSLLAQLPGGFYQTLASTDALIQAMCPFVLRNGTFVGVMVGGNFTSIGGVNAQSVAMIDPVTFKPTPQPGIQGTVNTLFCDDASETVYVGGAFEASISKNAITWVAQGNWANLPFSGFDGPVEAIARAPNGHIVFGGTFSGLGNTTNNASTTSQDDQALNLVTANVVSVGNLTSGNSITCPPNATTGSAINSPWLLRDNTPGYWEAQLRMGFQPSKLRLYNYKQDGRGTKSFRLTALPDGGIMNFTYTDPATGRIATCDATCPLSNNASIEYQDFFFVNTVGMNSIRIDVSQWYGAGGGLAGIQLFQSDIFTYAVDAFNEPACSGSSTLSNVTAIGAWRVTPGGQSPSDYMTVVTGPTTVASTEIVFEPDVRESGNYSVIVYTPGCLQDSSCSARAIVNITGTLTSSGGTTFNTMISQTNYNDKYDQVFTGRIDAASSSFRPRVTIRPSGLQTDQLIVASRVKLDLISSTGGLNGLYEYDPNNVTVTTDFGSSAINNAGRRLQPGAHFFTLAAHDNTIFSAGAYTDDNLSNIMSFSNNQIAPLPQGGLNNAVMALYSSTDLLYCGGNFTATAQAGGPAGLNNIAAFQFATNQWVPIGAGVDGPVVDVSPLPVNITAGTSETAIAFSGSFRNIKGVGSSPNIPANGFAVWVPSRNAWLLNLTDVTQDTLAGGITAYTYFPTNYNNTWLCAGTLTSLGSSVVDSAALRSAASGVARVQQFPMAVLPSSSSGSNSSSRTTTSSKSQQFLSQQGLTGVITGTYYNRNNHNVTVLAGYFNATGNNSAVIQNLLFLNHSGNANTVTGLPQGIDPNSTFLTVAIQNDLLVAGGFVTGQIGDARISGLVMYDLAASAYRQIQPAALAGNEVIVKAIATPQSSSTIYVGGQFDATSQGLACRSVCAYDTSTNQWNLVGGQLSGFVTALFWTSGSQLMATGNLTVSGNSTSLALYDPKQQTWSPTGTSSIPGAVTAFAPQTTDGTKSYIAGTANNGSVFLGQVNGNSYNPVLGLLQPGTNISGLELLPLTSSHSSTNFLDDDQALLVTGQLNITGYGRASSALFNGTTLTPFLLSSTSNGTSGSISQLFSSNGLYFNNNKPRHSRGIAVLVALCAALGTIFLLIFCGILLNYVQRRRAGYNTVPNMAYQDKHSNIDRVPPERLFGTLGQRPGAAPTV